MADSTTMINPFEIGILRSYLSKVNLPLQYIIDFDSTFTKVEALDQLAHIVFKEHPERKQLEQKISDITHQAMEGTMAFDEALQQRLSLLNLNRLHLVQLTDYLHGQVSESFKRNELFLRTQARNIYIVSGGFKEFILPVVTFFGILPSNVFANDFLFDQDGRITGFNKENPLSEPKGKVKLVRSLHLQGQVVVVGDGYTDYEIREAGQADQFYLYVENVRRTHLFDKADRVVTCLEDFI